MLDHEKRLDIKDAEHCHEPRRHCNLVAKREPPSEQGEPPSKTTKVRQEKSLQ